MFFRGLEFALFGDVMAVDGAGYNRQRNRYTRTSLGENYAGAGGELRLSTTSLSFAFKPNRGLILRF